MAKKPTAVQAGLVGVAHPLGWVWGVTGFRGFPHSPANPLPESLNPLLEVQKSTCLKSAFPIAIFVTNANGLTWLVYVKIVGITRCSPQFLCNRV